MKLQIKINLIIICFLPNIGSLLGQGLIFDSTEFNKQPEFKVDRAILPDRSSLENYLPVLYPQTGGTCVAMSIALARTIMYAYYTKTTDVAEITRNSFSPYYLYYCARNKSDYQCNVGLNPISALQIAKQVGFEKLARVEYPAYWPFTKHFLCPNSTDFLPPDKKVHLENASKYKISESFVTTSIEGIKSALAKKIPVILAMQVPKSFENPSSNLWSSLASETKIGAAGHAVVAIGYDDNLYGGAIRIANSWGDNWGDNGKIWIKYNDLSYWLDGAFIMIVAAQTYQSIPLSELGNKAPINYRNFISTEFDGKVNFNNQKLIKVFNENNKSD